VMYCNILLTAATVFQPGVKAFLLALPYWNALTPRLIGARTFKVHFNMVPFYRLIFCSNC
jgi:hypothetical protein